MRPTTPGIGDLPEVVRNRLLAALAAGQSDWLGSEFLPWLEEAGIRVKPHTLTNMCNRGRLSPRLDSARNRRYTVEDIVTIYAYALNPPKVGRPTKAEMERRRQEDATTDTTWQTADQHGGREFP